MSVFIFFIRDYPDRLDARRFSLRLCIAGHNYNTYDRGVTRLTAAGSWARRYLYIGGHGAACVCCCGSR